MAINFLKMTLPEMIIYWRTCLNDFGEGSDVDIASRMVAVVGSDYFDESQSEADGETQSDFSKLFELVLALEHDYTTSDRVRAQVWDEVRVFLERLEAKYADQIKSLTK